MHGCVCMCMHVCVCVNLCLCDHSIQWMLQMLYICVCVFIGWKYYRIFTQRRFCTMCGLEYGSCYTRKRQTKTSREVRNVMIECVLLTTICYMPGYDMVTALCKYVHACECLLVCTSECTYYTHTHTHIHTHTQTQTHTHACTNTHTYTHTAHTHTHIRTRVHKHTHTHTYIHIHAYTHILYLVQ